MITINNEKMTPKNYLLQYRDIDGEITSLNEDIYRLRELSTKTSTGNISDMPRATKDNTEASFVAIIEKIIDIEKQRNKKIAELLILKYQIESAITNVDVIRFRTLLRDKYINGLTLEQIAVNMDKSWRHIVRWHGQALQMVKVP